MSFDNADLLRLILAVLILISTIFVWATNYTKTVKLLKIIPRLNMAAYYLLVIFDIYKFDPSFDAFIKSGGGSVCGLVLFFGAEIYIQWANCKYGR